MDYPHNEVLSPQGGLVLLCICKKLTYNDYLHTYYEIKSSPPLPPSPGPLTGLLPAGPAPLPLLTLLLPFQLLLLLEVFI